MTTACGNTEEANRRDLAAVNATMERILDAVDVERRPDDVGTRTTDVGGPLGIDNGRTSTRVAYNSGAAGVEIDDVDAVYERVIDEFDPEWQINDNPSRRLTDGDVVRYLEIGNVVDERRVFVSLFVDSQEALSVSVRAGG